MTGETVTEQDASELNNHIQKAQGLAQALQEDLPPYLEAEAILLQEDFDVLEAWLEDAQEDGREALDGSLTVTDTAEVRVDHLQEEVGGADEGLEQKLTELEQELDAIEDELKEIEVPADAFVTYVDRSFAERYDDPSVTVATLLVASGQTEVDDLGLWPLDGLFGERTTDLAIPDEKTVNLSEEHRVYWETESDGGLIA